MNKTISQEQFCELQAIAAETYTMGAFLYDMSLLLLQHGQDEGGVTDRGEEICNPEYLCEIAKQAAHKVMLLSDHMDKTLNLGGVNTKTTLSLLQTPEQTDGSIYADIK